MKDQLQSHLQALLSGLDLGTEGIWSAHCCPKQRQLVVRTHGLTGGYGRVMTVFKIVPLGVVQIRRRPRSPATEPLAGPAG